MYEIYFYNIINFITSETNNDTTILKKMIQYTKYTGTYQPTMDSQLSNNTYFSQSKSNMGDEQCTETLRITLMDNKEFTYIQTTTRYDSFDGDTTSTQVKANGTWKVKDDKVLLEGETRISYADFKYCMDEDGTEKETTQSFHNVVALDQLQQMQITSLNPS